MAEVELGKLAPERSTDTEVKKFAQLMIDDHTKSLNSLKAIAAQHNIPVPTELDGRHRRLRDKLAKWHGNEFDRPYMDVMVDGHEDVLDERRSPSTNVPVRRIDLSARHFHRGLLVACTRRFSAAGRSACP